MASRAVRKLALTTHVLTSTGWFGAVVTFLVLAVSGVVGQDIQVMRSDYLAMWTIYAVAVIPLGLASAASGIVSSLLSDWGLFRHYWVLIKALVTIGLTLLMMVHGTLVRFVAEAAEAGNLSPNSFYAIRSELALDSIGAVIALAGATALSIYKPRARTGWGRSR